jgi:hypothetical protein
MIFVFVIKYNEPNSSDIHQRISQRKPEEPEKLSSSSTSFVNSVTPTSRMRPHPYLRRQ